MKIVQQIFFWVQKMPIIKSFVIGILFVPLFLIMRLIVDTKDFMKNFSNELAWGIAFGIGIGVVVLVHPLIFPHRYKQLGTNKSNK